MKLAIALCLLFTSQLVSAQAVGQGVWMLGGNAGFTSTKFKAADESNTTLFLNPNLGYFIADDLAIGLNLNLTSANEVTTFGLGPFVRFYFADAIFAQAGVDLGLGDNEFTAFQVGVGYSWFLSNGVAVEPMLFYRSHGVDLPGDAGDFSVIGLSIGVQAFVNHEHGMAE